MIDEHQLAIFADSKNLTYHVTAVHDPKEEKRGEQEHPIDHLNPTTSLPRFIKEPGSLVSIAGDR